MDQFIDLREVKSTLELHVYQPGKPYYLGAFLVGAYQEILGDLHNLFGDTTAIHVCVDDDHGYSIERVVEGDSVNEVIGYVQYRKDDLMRRVRVMAEESLRRGDLRMEESALLIKRYEEGLSGYTYLAMEDTLPPEPLTPLPTPANGAEQGADAPAGQPASPQAGVRAD
jgi:arginine decarboxylase